MTRETVPNVVEQCSALRGLPSRSLSFTRSALSAHLVRNPSLPIISTGRMMTCSAMDVTGGSSHLVDIAEQDVPVG